MPTSTRFEIATYRIHLGYDFITSSIGGVRAHVRGLVTCLGTGGESLDAYFLADDSPVPAALSRGEKSCSIFLSKDLMGNWTDMLRNEKPLYAHIFISVPYKSYISTVSEPVGEEE